MQRGCALGKAHLIGDLLKKTKTDLQNQASTILGSIANILRQALSQHDFEHFMLHEGLLGSATLMPAGSVLRNATLGRFKSEHDQLRAALQGQFKQFEEACKSSLSQQRYAQVTRALQQCEKMAQAAVGEDREWGAPVPSFHERVSKLLEHVETYAQEQVGDLKEVTRQLQDLSSLPTQQASCDDLVCMFACVCVGVHVCVCTRVRACICLYVRVCMHGFECVRVCICVRARCVQTGV